MEMRLKCWKKHAKGTKKQKRKAVEGDNLEKQNVAKCRIHPLPFNRKHAREQWKRMLFQAKSPKIFLEREAETTVFCKENTKGVPWNRGKAEWLSPEIVVK